jgi:hypothetical protein
MPKFINTLGNAVVAVAICDRCKFKLAYGELSPDRNNPGMRVCAKCNDEKDPYALPPRQTEKIALRYPRPEEDLE